MPRLAGTNEYYDAIAKQMEESIWDWKDDWRMAEIEMLERVIRRMRLEEGKTHREIQEHLEKHWGLKRGAYRRRLERVRKASSEPLP